MQFKIGARMLQVNTPSWAALEARVKERFAQKQGFSLATLNLDHLVQLRKNPAFLSAYQAQDFVVADGNPIVWMSRAAGQPVQLIPGSETILPLCKIAAAQDVPVALFGSNDTSLQAAKAALESTVPNLHIACTLAPPMGFDPSGQLAEALLERIKASGARLCFVALGAPKQEQFSAKARDLAPEIGFANIGAGLDFISGQQTRAPKWVQNIAMEWLWRALSNPKRLAARYAKCIAILPGHMLRALLLRIRAS